MDRRRRLAAPLDCGFAFPPPRHLHPLRAALLWAASVTGLLAVGLTLRAFAGRERTATASG
jgi:hypothetical protein